MMTITKHRKYWGQLRSTSSPINNPKNNANKQSKQIAGFAHLHNNNNKHARHTIYLKKKHQQNNTNKVIQDKFKQILNSS